MPAHSKIDDENFLNAYYKALKDGLSLTEFSDSINTNFKTVWARVRAFKMKTGKELPKLRHGSSKRDTDNSGPKTPRQAKTAFRPKPSISAEEFVRIWQTSPTFEEACKTIGGHPRHISAKADRFRKRKIPLKKFATGKASLDIPGLIALAQSLAPSTPDAQPA